MIFQGIFFASQEDKGLGYCGSELCTKIVDLCKGSDRGKKERKRKHKFLKFGKRKITGTNSKRKT